MNKHLLKQQSTSYEADYALWCAEQSALLREGRLSGLDRENIAQEIESLGRSDKREISNRLGVLLLHLLKWDFQPERRKLGWLLTISEQRHQIGNLLEESPSLLNYPGTKLVQEYAFAHRRAAYETKLSPTAFPANPPYTIEQILDQDFFPGTPWSRDKLIED